MPIVINLHWHANGNVTQQTEFNKIPIGTISPHHTLCEDLRYFRFEQFGKKIGVGKTSDRLLIYSSSKEFPSLARSRSKLAQVDIGALPCFCWNND